MLKPLLLGLTLGVLSFCSSANATSCHPISPLEHVENTSVIFYGKVAEGSGGPADDEMHVAEFEVLRAYKGTVEKSVKVRYFNDHAALRGWGFEPGQAVMVFADVDSSASGENVVAEVHYCSMVPYYLRSDLHADYWDILVGKKMFLDVPQFEEYMSDVYSGSIRSPDFLSHPDARTYRTRLRNAAKGEVNFAGEYVLTTWGCGTTCIMGAVINAKSGVVHFLPGSICCWFEANEDAHPIDYRIDSNLIVFTGLLNEQEPIATHYYEFRNGEFQLLKTDTSLLER